MGEPDVRIEEKHIPEGEQAEESAASYQDIVKKMEELGYIDCGLDI